MPFCGLEKGISLKICIVLSMSQISVLLNLFMYLDLKVLRFNPTDQPFCGMLHHQKTHLPFVEINTKEEELKYLKNKKSVTKTETMCISFYVTCSLRRTESFWCS